MSIGRSKQRVIDEAQFNYNRGIDAARDAVAALVRYFPADDGGMRVLEADEFPERGYIALSYALAAIDGVKS